MHVRDWFVVVICFTTSFASDGYAFFWGSNNEPREIDTPKNEKPAISLSCLLYGDEGCMKTCQLTSLLYDAEINPKCYNNIYCLCNEVYHMPGGDLTVGDFQTMSFDTLWDNFFENTSQANAIRRYVKKNPDMLALVDSMIRDPHVSGDEIKNQLIMAYPNLSPEFKQLISVKRGMKSDLMSGDHLMYEDILDNFNELITGIQSSNDELQNIKYRRRMGKILESIDDENELGHLVDLVKLSGDESLYNYVTSFLKKRGYVLDSDLAAAIPIVGVFSNGATEETHTTNVIREHNLGMNDINENDMIELSVITSLAKPSNDNTVSIQITQDNQNQPPPSTTVSYTTQDQTPSVTYTEIGIEGQTPTSVMYSDVGTEQAQTPISVTYTTIDSQQAPSPPSVLYTEVGLPSVSYTEVGIQQEQTSPSVTYTEFGIQHEQAPSSYTYTQIDTQQDQTPPSTDVTYTEVMGSGDGNDVTVVSLSGVLAQMQSDIATLGKEVDQLKSTALGMNSNAISFANTNSPSTSSQPLTLDFNGMTEVLNTVSQDSNFEDSVAAIMKTLMSADTTSNSGNLDTAQVEFLNSIPTYMAQVANTPVTFPDGVTVSKVFSNNIPVASVPMVAAITPEAIENSVQYTISKRVKLNNGNQDNSPTDVTIYDSASTVSPPPPTDVTSGTQISISTTDNNPSPAQTSDAFSSTQISISSDTNPSPAPSYDTSSSTQVSISTSDVNPPPAQSSTQISVSTTDTNPSPAQNYDLSSTQISVSNSDVNTATQISTAETNDGSSGMQVLISTSDTNPSSGDAMMVDGNFANVNSETSTDSPASSLDIQITQSDGNDATVQTSESSTNSVTVKSGGAKKTKVSSTNSSPRTKVTVTEGTTSAKTSDSAKPARVVRKSNKSPQTETTIVSQSSVANDAVAVDSQLQVEETQVDEAPAVVESVTNVKKRQSRKSADQSDTTSSVTRSVSSTTSSVQADEDSTINVSVTTQTSEADATTQQEESQNNIYYAMANGNVENAVPVVQAQESSSTFGRFGDHVRKFANSFKKS